MSTRYKPDPAITPLAMRAVANARKLTESKGKRGFTKAQLDLITTALDYVLKGQVSDTGLEKGIRLRPEERLVLPGAIDAFRQTELSILQQKCLNNLCNHYYKTLPAREKVE